MKGSNKMQLPNTSSSTAYDFSLFETVEKQQKKTVEPIKLAPVSVAKTGVPLKVILMIAMVLGVCLMFLYSKVVLSELTTKISEETTALQSALSINSALQSELDAEVATKNVEDYAINELGLQKVLSTQEEYVNVNLGDMTEVAQKDDGNLFVAVKDWFEGILEYLGF